MFWKFRRYYAMHPLHIIFSIKWLIPAWFPCDVWMKTAGIIRNVNRNISELCCYRRVNQLYPLFMINFNLVLLWSEMIFKQIRKIFLWIEVFIKHFLRITFQFNFNHLQKKNVFVKERTVNLFIQKAFSLYQNRDVRIENTSKYCDTSYTFYIQNQCFVLPLSYQTCTTVSSVFEKKNSNKNLLCCK